MNFDKSRRNRKIEKSQTAKTIAQHRAAKILRQQQDATAALFSGFAQSDEKSWLSRISILEEIWNSR